MIVRFDETYADLVCDDVARTPMRSPEERDRHSHEAEGKGSPVDPWDGRKPHAADGFVAKYCR